MSRRYNGRSIGGAKAILLGGDKARGMSVDIIQKS